MISLACELRPLLLLSTALSAVEEMRYINLAVAGQDLGDDDLKDAPPPKNAALRGVVVNQPSADVK